MKSGQLSSLSRIMAPQFPMRTRLKASEHLSGAQTPAGDIWSREDNALTLQNEFFEHPNTGAIFRDGLWARGT